MNIQVLTPNINIKKIDDRNTELDFGTINRNTQAIVELMVDTQNYPKFKTQSTCGCSTSDDEKMAGGRTKVKIEYRDTHKAGTVAKTIKLLDDNKIIQLIKIRININ